MGNLRSVEKALERVGARAELTRATTTRIRAADGVVLPGRRARSRRRWSNVRELGARRAAARAASPPGVPDARHLPGHAAAVRVVQRARRGRGARAAARARSSSSTRRAEGAADRLERGRLAARARALTEGLPDPCAFYFVHSFAPRPSDAGDVLGTADYGGAFVCAVERAPVYGVQFHPEKSSTDGLRLLRNFVRSARVAHPSRAVILLPAIDIRDGKAVRLRQGDFDERDRLRRRPARGRAPLGRGRRALPARGRPRRRARGRAGRTSQHLRADHRELRGARSSTAAGCARSRRSGAALEAGRRPRRARHRRLHRPRAARRGARGAAPSACWSRSTCATARCRSPAGRTRPRRAPRTRSGCMQRTRRDAASSTRTSTATACSRAPTSTRSQRGRRGRPRALHLLGRHRLARRPPGAARPAAREPRGRDRRARRSTRAASRSPRRSEAAGGG